MKLFLIAGEPSGDRLGAALMAGLKALEPAVEFAGVGGPAMQAEGLESLFPMEELSVMGLAEILPKYRALKRRIAQTAAEVLRLSPAALITIDSPDFCLRVARIVREARPDQRVIHYVAPSVWAWRPGRAAKMAKVVDHVLALLPFEPPYMEAAGMTCDFVGHPVVAEPLADRAAAEAFREASGIGSAPLLMVLPGSRKGEVGRLGPRFGAALERVVAARPELRVVVPTVPHVAGLVREMTATWPGRPVVVEGAAEKRAAFAAADAALAASGTVSLELAANRVPMVVAYDFNPLSRAIIGRMLKLDTVTLVNLVTGTRAVPEFLGKACRPERIAPAVVRMLADGPERAAQVAAMADCMVALGAGGEAPGLRAARSVLAHLG
ncbi:lipid-A-disaccharide synthase [Solirhodobacter olei]|uniref:lipid-A-disaccharide synthase n=1 Tax=Solirhodobacter olei TaxID=2493082 RepID=UPI000FD871D2|nr:lipid-A-disaccharide synthase [Solirhodobacter olei]